MKKTTIILGLVLILCSIAVAARTYSDYESIQPYSVGPLGVKSNYNWGCVFGVSSQYCNVADASSGNKLVAGHYPSYPYNGQAERYYDEGLNSGRKVFEWKPYYSLSSGSAIWYILNNAGSFAFGVYEIAGSYGNISGTIKVQRADGQQTDYVAVAGIGDESVRICWSNPEDYNWYYLNGSVYYTKSLREPVWCGDYNQGIYLQVILDWRDDSIQYRIVKDNYERTILSQTAVYNITYSDGSIDTDLFFRMYIGNTEGVGVDEFHIYSGLTAPSVSYPEVVPYVADETTQLTCSYEFYDDDGDPDYSGVLWFVNGVYSSSGIYSAVNYAVGDLVYCRVTPYDGVLYGSPKDAGAIVIQNSIPEEEALFGVTNLFIEDKGTELECRWNFVVFEGNHTDNSTYRWKVNGVSVSYDNVDLPSSEYSEGEKVNCYVTPSNGSLEGDEVSTYIFIGQGGYVYANRAMCINPDDLSIANSAVISDNTYVNVSYLVASDITGDLREDFLSSYVYDLRAEEIIADFGTTGWVMPFDSNSDLKTDILYSTGSKVILLESAIKPTAGTYCAEAGLALDCKVISDNKVQIQFLPCGPSNTVEYALYSNKYSAEDPIVHGAIEDNVFTLTAVASGTFTARGVVTYYLEDGSKTIAEAECSYSVSVPSAQNCAFDDHFDYSTPIDTPSYSNKGGWAVDTLSEIVPISSEITLNGYTVASVAVPCSRDMYAVETVQTIDDTESDLLYVLRGGTLSTGGEDIYTVKFKGGSIYFNDGAVGTYEVGTEFTLRIEVSVPSNTDAGAVGTVDIYYSGQKIKSGATLVSSVNAGVFTLLNSAGLAKIDRVRIYPLTGSSPRVTVDTTSTLKLVGQDIDCDGNYSRDEYTVIDGVCSVYGTKEFGGKKYCSLDDLKDLFSNSPSDSLCFDQAVSYCSYISYPIEQGLTTKLPYETNRYASACSTELLLTASADTILVPMRNALGNFAKNNLVFVLVVIVFLVVLLPILMKKNERR